MLDTVQLGQFIDEALTTKANKLAYIGNVDFAAASRIKSVCGMDSGAVRHTLKKTEHNLRTGDLLSIVDVINTGTDIKVSPFAHQNNECLEISKDIDGDLTFIVEARINHGGWLALVTAYRQKK